MRKHCVLNEEMPQGNGKFCRRISSLKMSMDLHSGRFVSRAWMMTALKRSLSIVFGWALPYNVTRSLGAVGAAAQASLTCGRARGLPGPTAARLIISYALEVAGSFILERRG
jgi:hypothetical protein